MPVINLDINDLNFLLRKDYPVDELVSRIPMIGADAGAPEGVCLPVEFFPDRPDMFSVEGAARALRYFLAPDEELKGMPLPDYPVRDSGITMRVNPSVAGVRPFVVGAVIRNVTMTDPLIQSLMDHQEKLHLTIGRKRVKAAIGVHDLSRVNGPFTYTTASGDFSFVPLTKDREMSLTQILRRHEKGVAYAHILEGTDTYPIILDRDQNVLSFPPIINGQLTSVEEDTTDIFIDVTGMELRPISLALNIISTAFAERGADIESMDITYDAGHPGFRDETDGGERRERGEGNDAEDCGGSDGAIGRANRRGGDGGRGYDCDGRDVGGMLTTPDLEWRERNISVQNMNSLLNTSLSADEWVLPFKRMTLEAEPAGGGANLRIRYPAYRADILHDWDIYEDAAVGYGYDRIRAVSPAVHSTGAPLPIVPLVRKFQRTLMGLGFSEVKTLTLTGEREGYGNMDLPLPENDILLHNPITEDHTRLRSSLIPSLLSILKANRHRDLPQRIMEPGIVVEDGRNHWKGAGVIIHPRAGFTEMKSIIQSILPAFGKEFTLSGGDHPSFIPGRCARIILDDAIGYFGELHPKVISAFSLEYPVLAFELTLESFGYDEKKHS